MEKEYQAVIKGISSISQGYQSLAENHLLQLAKPPGSLGQLETMAARLCGIFQSLRPQISKRCILVVAADNGVVAEGIASAPMEVTKIQTVNIALGVTGVGVLAQQAKADIRVTDVGIQGEVNHPLVGQLVGRGAGLSDQAYEQKIQVIEEALALHQPSQDDPLAVLAAVGGLDLAALTGIFLGAAYWQKPVVIDGFISMVAALCAYRLNPLVKEYMFASHASFERGYAFAMEELGLTPCLHLNMRLGEYSALPIL